MWRNESVHRLDLGVNSHSKGFWGMESEPKLTPREKSPLPEKSSPEEDRTHNTAGQWAQHTTNELFRTQLVWLYSVINTQDRKQKVKSCDPGPFAPTYSLTHRDKYISANLEGFFLGGGLRSPAISLGFTTLGWDFCVCVSFLIQPLR